MKIFIEEWTLVYSTCLQGTSQSSSILDLAVDSEGCAYAIGFTEDSNFPTTTDALQPVHQGILAGFISKLSSDGSSLVFWVDRKDGFNRVLDDLNNV